MKKMLAVVLSLVTVFVLGTAVVFAAKHHNSAQVTTIADIKANGWDEQRVLVDGEFTEHIYKDLYTFTDNEGNSMTVEVDDDIWYQLSMQNRAELRDYLMAKYDTSWGQDTTRPFIMENDSLMAE